VFIVYKVVRYQRREGLKLSLILFAGELLGLSVVYACLIWRTWRTRTRLSGRYQLVLALVVSLLGCLSAFILCFLEPGDRINWISALWVSTSNNKSCLVVTNKGQIHFGTVALWLIRSIIIGLRSFGCGTWLRNSLVHPRRTSDDVELVVPRRPRAQGFNELEDYM
jgi:hypothetical protein